MLTNMKRVSRDKPHFKFDKFRSPVLDLAPGERVVFETLDACSGEVRSIDGFREYRRLGKQGHGNPLTGPVFVEGAKAGGTLVIDILGIELDPTGFQLIGPDRAMIRDEVVQWDHYPVSAEGDRLVLPRGITLPADPVIGTMGTAPDGPATNAPNRLGGNMDVPQIRTGARVYLPIEVEGALFSLGDVHARQGDGEVVGAPEIGAKVTVKFGVLDERQADWPMVENETHWYTITCGRNEAEAFRIGVLESARFLERTNHVRFNDALILLTMLVELHCSRTGKWGSLEPVACTGFSKALIAEATAGYHDP